MIEMITVEPPNKVSATPAPELASDVEMIRLEAYDGRYYAITTPAGDTLYLPSVTHVLSAVTVGYNALEQWRMEEAARIGKEGHRIDMFVRAERGTAVHYGVELLNKGHEIRRETGHKDIPFDDDEWKAICRYATWFRSVNARVIASEMTVFWLPVDDELAMASGTKTALECVSAAGTPSSRYGVAGTLDAILEIDAPVKKGEEPRRVYALPDVKTSKAVYDAHRMQAAIYLMAARQMWPEKIGPDAIAGVLALNTTSKAGYTFSVVPDAGELQRRFRNMLTCFYDAHPTFTPEVDILPGVLSLV